MNVKEFQAWLSRNEGKGGQRPSYDPFNKAKKGSERNTTAEEYASKDVQEYHSYPEIKDLRTDDDDKKQNDSSQAQSRTKNAGKTRAQSIRGFFARVVTVVMGSVLVVTGYQSIKAHTVTTIGWVWNEENTAVVMQLLNSSGGVVREIPAEVTSSKVDATCEEEGLITYVATAEEGNKTYSDTKYIVISPVGHRYVEKSRTDLGDGKTEITSECEHCHEEQKVIWEIIED